jgi:alpha-tubulin suppressor-like RCC1 family protein
VLFANGRVLCWGGNGDGVLGINSTTDVVGPAAIASQGYISFSSTFPVVQLSCQVHVCAVFANGRVSCWGVNDSQQLGENLPNTNSRGTDTNTMANAVFVSFATSINTIPVIQVSTGKYIYIYIYI